MSWLTTHAPKTSADIISPNAQRVKEFIQNYRSEKKRALFLYGPPGSCKSSTVYAIAHELNLEITETNASDARTKDALDRTVGAAMIQQSLFSSGKVILIDEVDGLSGTKDRGAPGEIAKIIEKSAFPVILTANDPWQDKLKPLRKASTMLEFPPLDVTRIITVLERICPKEPSAHEGTSLRARARRSGGNLRGAINDLHSTIVNKHVDNERITTISERAQTEALKNALLKVFKTRDPTIALDAYEHVTEDHDTIMPWLDENLPLEYTRPDDLARAYDSLSRADIFKRRIMRRQHWRFLTFISMHLSAGIALAKTERNTASIEYKETRRFLKIWQAKMQHQKRTSIAEHVCGATHCSTAKTLTHILPYLHIMARHNCIPFNLDAEEVTWLKNH